jgi:hypothetical protein
MKNRLLLLIPTIITTLLVVACGGGGSGSTTPVAGGGGTDSASVSLGGKVIDGYIKGATVCLDLNSNNMCDSGEPSTTSGTDGSYSLSYSGSVSGLQIISVVPLGAVDSDLGVIAIAYNLLAPVPTDPASYTNTHVTPLTTLVAATINQAGGQAALSPAAAEAQIKANFSLPNDATLLNNDFKAKTTGTNTTLASISTYTAAAIAQVSNNLSSNATVAAQLNPGQITQAAVQQVQNSILPTVMSNAALTPAAQAVVNKAMNGGGTSTLVTNVASSVSSAGLSPSSIASATTGGTITGNVLNIVNGTKSIGSSNTVVSLADLFKNSGIVLVNLNNYVHFINSSGLVSCLDNSYKIIPFLTAFAAQNNNCSGKSALKVEFIQFDLNTPNSHFDGTFDLVGKDWFKDYSTNQELTYDGTSWVANSNSLIPTITNNCINLPTNSKVFQQACAVQVNVSGQKMTSYIPDLCINSSSNTPLANCSTATFPTGSYGYSLTISVQSSITDATYNGYFSLGVDKTWSGYCTNNTCSTGTLANFISYTSSNVQYMGSNCNTPFKITNYDTASKTGVISFASNTSGSCNYGNSFVVVETQNFNVITKGGKDLMIFPTPATYKANNPGSIEPYKLFAQGCLGTTTNCGIYQGSYMPVNFSLSIPFNGNLSSNTQFVNPTLFNSVMSTQGNTAYPYKNSGSSGTPVTSGLSAPQ